MSEWLTIECERALYVDRGRTPVLCDRLPSPITLVVKPAAHTQQGYPMTNNANDVSEGVEPWIVWSNEHRSFWAPNRRGYTGRIERAGRYTKAEAEAICNNANYRANSTIYEGTPPEICMPAPEATLSPPASPQGVERVREIVDLWFEPWGAAKGEMWEDLSGDKPFDPNVALEMIREALATLPSEPLRDDVTRGPTCANPCCASPAAGFPVIYFGPAQEPRRYRLEVPKGMCGECQPLFHADAFFTDASRVEMSRMIDEQGLALPDYDRLAVDWIGIEDPAFAEVAALRQARLWFG
jgi:hypothetical protein